MKQPLKLGLNCVVLAFVAVASAGVPAAEAGKVKSGGGTVGEIYGRAAPSHTASGARSVSLANKGTVSSVVGRGSQIPAATSGQMDTAAVDTAHFGRGPGPLASGHRDPGAGGMLARTQ